MQPDTIIPEPFNPQSWNRYSYVLNNPVNFSDPSGHSVCGLSGSGMCTKDEELMAFANKTVLDYGGRKDLREKGIRNDLESVARIVEKAARLYKTYDEMIPALSMVFLGYRESNYLTVWNHSPFGGSLGIGKTPLNPCSAAGRDIIDCSANEETGWFRDTGFHTNFKDNASQPFHFWAYLATAANTEGAGPASYFPGRVVGFWANVGHEMAIQDSGSTWQDYALARMGTNIGTLVGHTQKSFE